MKKIEVGQIVYKKVRLPDVKSTQRCNILNCTACRSAGLQLDSDGYGTIPITNYVFGIVELEVVEPGFIATYDSNLGGTINYQNKGRVRAAKVLSITNLDGTPVSETMEATSGYISTFKYTVGSVVRPDVSFDICDIACSDGIHCFETREQAVAYQL